MLIWMGNRKRPRVRQTEFAMRIMLFATANGGRNDGKEQDNA
jgi:hypothetical protein